MYFKYLGFSRLRVILLISSASLSLLVSITSLFIIPNARPHGGLVIFVMAISLISGLFPLLSALWQQIRGLRNSSKLFVGLELLWSIIVLLLMIINILTEINTMINFELLRSCSLTAVIITGMAAFFLGSYVTILATLVLNTHWRSRKTDIWFADVSKNLPPFIYPRLLKFLRTCSYDSVDQEAQEVFLQPGTEVDSQLLTRIRWAQRIHTPGCTCGEKPLPTPTYPEEYRTIHKLFQKEWSSANIRTPVPALSLPTERERRKSLYFIGFEDIHYFT